MQVKDNTNNKDDKNTIQNNNNNIMVGMIKTDSQLVEKYFAQMHGNLTVTRWAENVSPCAKNSCTQLTVAGNDSTAQFAT